MRAPRLPAWTATLTWKAAVFIAVMCCALAALLGTLVHVSVTGQTVHDSREKALARLTDVSRLYEAGEPLPRFAGVDPVGLPAPLRALAVRGERGTMVADDRGRPTMWAAGPAEGPADGPANGPTDGRVGGRALAVRVDYTQSAGTIDALDRSILGSSVLAIGATLLVGAFAVTRVTRRLHLTAQVARRISAGDLDARVDDPRTKDPSRPQDEVATVSGALDTMASSLQRKLQSEQRFTADVAHELRTPLTGLSAAAELLPEGRPSELVRDRVRAMRALTEDLLEISRLDARNETVDLAVHELGPLAGRVVRASGTGTEVRVVRDAAVVTDRRRVERVLGNLVANAHRHGAPPVVVTVDGPVVSVRDHGPGYPAYLLDSGPQRFRTESGGKGHGLGLTIAVGQAEVIGAELVFADAPDGGAEARLRLPEYVPPAPAEPEE
ncbi:MULTISPECIES: HAMP domain-containing sensor histidine kinase [unclassified Streptomyces]|uniref:sensor histidine kinase n=1 Tax=unclassified Streptomyces TaxID=2593676 RepID=UPI0006FCDADA|nr:MULTISPECIES: HAMP domain-containing sensor histidine kinase [unclassified Streptomyces]KQX47299.1 ATPase [Streptomyces sp. Root1304]KRA94606.1 ATPase [Streptomyces sp. Root66D1]